MTPVILSFREPMAESPMAQQPDDHRSGPLDQLRSHLEGHERRNLAVLVRGLKRRAMHIYWLLLMLIAIGVVVWAASKRLRGH
jgi:hypothetical protein